MLPNEHPLPFLLNLCVECRPPKISTLARKFIESTTQTASWRSAAGRAWTPASASLWRRPPEGRCLSRILKRDIQTRKDRLCIENSVYCSLLVLYSIKFEFLGCGRPSFRIRQTSRERHSHRWCAYRPPRARVQRWTRPPCSLTRRPGSSDAPSTPTSRSEGNFRPSWDRDLKNVLKLSILSPTQS